MGRVRSLGVRIFGLRCLGIRNFGSAVFWLAGYLGVRYFGWSPFSGCLDPWASLLGVASDTDASGTDHSVIDSQASDASDD